MLLLLINKWFLSRYERIEFSEEYEIWTQVDNS